MLPKTLACSWQRLACGTAYRCARQGSVCGGITVWMYGGQGRCFGATRWGRMSVLKGLVVSQFCKGSGMCDVCGMTTGVR